MQIIFILHEDSSKTLKLTCMEHFHFQIWYYISVLGWFAVLERMLRMEKQHFEKQDI